MMPSVILGAEHSKMISVVIPVRNRPDVIHRAIDSVLAQTLPVLEIIVVDDCSTDHTVPSIEMRQGDCNLRIIRNELASGAPRARNKGAATAQGEFIAFLDSDDAWHPQKLERQIAMLVERPGMVAVFTNILRIRDGVPAETTCAPESVYLADLFRSNILGGCSTAMIRRSAFEQVGGFQPDLPSCQDWDLWLRLAQLSDLGCCTEPLTHYYFDASDRISSHPERVMAGHAKVMESIYALQRDVSERRKLQRHHNLYLAETAFYSLGNEDIGKDYALRTLKRPENIRAFFRSIKLLLLHSRLMKG